MSDRAIVSLRILSTWDMYLLVSYVLVIQAAVKRHRKCVYWPTKPSFTSMSWNICDFLEWPDSAEHLNQNHDRRATSDRGCGWGG